MYQDTLEININPSYNADEFIDDLKAELLGEIDSLLIQCEIDGLKKDAPTLEPEIALERIAIVKEIMKRLNLS